MISFRDLERFFTVRGCNVVVEQCKDGEQRWPNIQEQAHDVHFAEISMRLCSFV